jgi:hypothetical protein
MVPLTSSSTVLAGGGGDPLCHCHEIALVGEAIGWAVEDIGTTGDGHVGADAGKLHTSNCSA